MLWGCEVPRLTKATAKSFSWWGYGCYGIIKSVSFGPLTTDHNVIYCTLNIQKPSLPYKTIKLCRMKIEPYCSQDPKDITQDRHVAYNIVVGNIFDKHASEKTVTITIRLQWWTLLRKRKKCRKHEATWWKTQLEIYRQICSDQQNRVNSILPATKVKYYHEKVIRCGKNQKALFHIVKNLMNPETKTRTAMDYTSSSKHAED